MPFSDPPGFADGAFLERELTAYRARTSRVGAMPTHRSSSRHASRGDVTRRHSSHAREGVRHAEAKLRRQRPEQSQHTEYAAAHEARALLFDSAGAQLQISSLRVPRARELRVAHSALSIRAERHGPPPNATTHGIRIDAVRNTVFQPGPISFRAHARAVRAYARALPSLISLTNRCARTTSHHPFAQRASDKLPTRRRDTVRKSRLLDGRRKQPSSRLKFRLQSPALCVIVSGSGAEQGIELAVHRDYAFCSLFF